MLNLINEIKGFSQDGQYAVCLALLVKVHIKLDVICCSMSKLALHPFTSPTLLTTVTQEHQHHHKGTLFIAMCRDGTHQLPLLFSHGMQQQQLEMPH
jgi:3'-phosphoadenosine 5'-phosphosulfate (PAPS) 3'-phosphatase